MTVVEYEILDITNLATNAALNAKIKKKYLVLLTKLQVLLLILK